MEYVAIASTLVSAYGQYSAGKYQKSMYQKQADWAEIQGESEALAYERAGNEALNKTLRTMATINARASAGNLNPFTGSAGNLQSYALNFDYLYPNTIQTILFFFHYNIYQFFHNQ